MDWLSQGIVTSLRLPSHNTRWTSLHSVMTYDTNTILAAVIHLFYIIFLPSDTLIWRPKPLGWEQYQPHSSVVCHNDTWCTVQRKNFTGIYAHRIHQKPNLIWWNASINLFLYYINLLKSTGYVMHQQFNIQQLYALPTLHLCVLYLSQNKQRLVPHIT